MTLTLAVINAAAQVTFLVSGASKAEIVGEILAAGGGSHDYPAAKVGLTNGRLTWIIDRDAATDLPAHVVEPIGGSERDGPGTERDRRRGFFT